MRGLEEIVSVGDVGRPRAPGARAEPTAPGLVDLADRLSDRLETRVKVDLGRAKGKITMEFATLADLERIVDIIDPRTAPTARSESCTIKAERYWPRQSCGFGESTNRSICRQSA